MQAYTDMALSNLFLSLKLTKPNRWHRDWDQYWIGMEKQYASIGHSGNIPACSFPILLAIALDRKIPFEAPPVHVAPVDPIPIPKERLDYRKKAEPVGA